MAEALLGDATSLTLVSATYTGTGIASGIIMFPSNHYLAPDSLKEEYPE